jgi:3',5'-cyclic AMP phosphodiesterase CpdA
MKRVVPVLLLLLPLFSLAQSSPFRFAFISDTHIGSPNGGAEEDLRRTVADINAQAGIDFVVITGDITELGKNTEIALAKAAASPSQNSSAATNSFLLTTAFISSAAPPAPTFA